MHTAFSPSYAECHCPIYFGSLNVPHTCPKRILSSPWAFFLLPRLQDDFFSMSFLSPWTMWEPLTSALWSISHLFHDSICDLLQLFNRRHVPCSVPKTQEAPSIQQGHKNTHSGINQLIFWVTTSMTNKPRQQGLNPRIWFKVHILYIRPRWTLSFQLFLCLIINTCVCTHIHQSWEWYDVTIQFEIPSFISLWVQIPHEQKGHFVLHCTRLTASKGSGSQKHLRNEQRRLFSEHLPNICITPGAWKSANGTAE